MSQKSRKIRAIAAGGAVLGVGAAITLAAWSDSELADGLFGAGSFDIEGSATGADDDWASHTDSPLRLAFGGTDVAENLAPGVSVYEEYHLRNAGTVDAYISYDAATPGALDLGTDISYGMVSTTAETCDEAAFEAGTPVEAGSEFILAPETGDSYCFQVTLADNYGNTAGESGTIAWTFNANQESAAAGVE